ncbi:MAG: bifunctional aspartate kinase/homoserine dehydrogenase I [Rectinemataceae bacterium]
MKIMKFGGTSVGSPESVRRLVALVEAEGERIVVVSAFSGVTDSLIRSARQAEAGGDKVAELVSALKKRHSDMAQALVLTPILPGTLAFLEACFRELEGLLLGIGLLHELTPRALDLVMSFGERMSARIIADAFVSMGKPARAVDARRIIRTDDVFGSAHFLEPETFEAVKAELAAATSADPTTPAEPKEICVVTGFIGSTQEGVTTTLGRGGSDFTAGILGAALGADEIQICTDVDGIMTADPRLVPEAFLIEELSYEEALELTHFGAKVLHPPTLRPAMAKGIPVRIRNPAKPECPGSRIGATAAPGAKSVRGIASIQGIVLVRIQGPGLIGVKGTAGRLFACLAASGVNVILISQASSEHSICFAVRREDSVQAMHALRREFSLEIGAGLVESPHVEDDLCVVAAVGERMRHKPGISGKLFGALGRNGINIMAIAQGSSELNISVVIASRDEAKALEAVHTAFFLSEIRSVKIFLAGTGLIGGTLLAQLSAQRSTLLARHSIRIDLSGLVNRHRMAISESGIDPAKWRDALADGEPNDMSAFVARMKSMNLPGTIFCDCTASDDLPEFYEGILHAAIAIVTPNKRANAGPVERYRALTGYARENGIPYRYETTVGAGLPVIAPLQDLVSSGDGIVRIEAVLSGTISYVLNSFSGEKRFSALVREAQALGYTEPDPRDDLSATDAARKTLILAREAGIGLDFADIRIEPLLPKTCFDAPDVESFFRELEKFDAEYEHKQKDAASRGAVLRYISTIESDGTARLAFREAGPDDPFRNLAGTENMVAFTTARYDRYPLVVKGPGAGAAVTAGGVFADIVRIARAGA